MSIKDIGALRGADEGLNHQIIDTFATVSESDHAWTEKIWGSVASTDGSLQVDFGIGRYHNRGVIDAFAGVSRGHEQWTVRGSRELDPNPEETAVGPIRYEIVDPLTSVRFILEPNDVQPIAFDVTLTGVTPPFFEDRNLVRNAKTGRIDVDVIRYHQGGWAEGTISVDGEDHQVTADKWFGFRDHSWGVRQGVGSPRTDLVPVPRIPKEFADNPAALRGGMKWAPCFFRRPDGSHYETAIFLTQGVWAYESAYINDADGSQQRVRSIDPRVDYDTTNRFVRGGELGLVMDNGDERTIEFETLGESGFFLKTAGYGSWKDHIHGSWRGELHLDGEFIADCWDADHLPVLGQFRDTPIRVREGDAEGYGIMESMLHGKWPELGLDRSSDFYVKYD